MFINRSAVTSIGGRRNNMAVSLKVYKILNNDVFVYIVSRFWHTHFTDLGFIFFCANRDLMHMVSHVAISFYRCSGSKVESYLFIYSLK